jgi:hypothetical protein
VFINVNIAASGELLREWRGSRSQALYSALLGASTRTLQRAESGEGVTTALFRSAELLQVLEARVPLVMVDRRGRVLWRSRLAAMRRLAELGSRIEPVEHTLAVPVRGGRLLVLP